MRWLILLVFTLLTGCAGMTSLESRSAEVSSADRQPLVLVFQKYRGAPYIYGGTDARGFDCSGFIQLALQEAYGLSVPRTTDALARTGTAVRRDQLRIGDLVFFYTSVKQLHAGIYSNKGRFIHASTSKGVIESNLDNPYWQRRYFQARRLL
jgi:cell wall-associated NlpC family hydrolase